MEKPSETKPALLPRNTAQITVGCICWVLLTRDSLCCEFLIAIIRTTTSLILSVGMFGIFILVSRLEVCVYIVWLSLDSVALCQQRRQTTLPWGLSMAQEHHSSPAWGPCDIDGILVSSSACWAWHMGGCPGLTLDLTYSYKLAWRSGLVAPCGGHLQACPAHLAHVGQRPAEGRGPALSAFIAPWLYIKKLWMRREMKCKIRIDSMRN